MGEKDELPQPIPKVGWPRVQFDGYVATIRDRVVQTAAKLVLEPIFEADFEDSAYGYRPKSLSPGTPRSARRPRIRFT